MGDLDDALQSMNMEFKLYSELTSTAAYGDIGVKEVHDALRQCDYDFDKALAFIKGKHASFPTLTSPGSAVKRTTTSIGGTRVSVDVMSEDQPEPRVSIGAEEGSETQDVVHVIPSDSQTLDRIEQSEAPVEVNEEHEKLWKDSEPQLSAPIGSEEGSQETPVLVPETPLDSQTLELVEESEAMVEVNEELIVQSGEREKFGEDSGNIPLQPEPQVFASIGSEVASQEMLVPVPEIPLNSQTLERVKESKAVIVVKEEPNIQLEEDAIKPERGSESRPDVPEVEMVDVVHATPLQSRMMDPVADVVKIEPICDLDSDHSITESKAPSMNLGVLKSMSSEPYFKQRYKIWKEEQEKARIARQTQSCVQKKPVEVKKEVVMVEGIEDGDFPTEPDWLMVGDGIVTATSTTKRRTIQNNEVVEFEYPPPRYKAPPIVRVRNKRLGEIGRLPMEWSKCLIPLVQSGIVKVRGKCVSGPMNLEMMREMLLYLGFYAHKNFFAERENRISLNLAGNSVVESNMNPLRSLFQLLKIKPLQEALCTAEDLERQKRRQSLDVKTRMAEVESSLAKRRKVSPTQAIELKQDESERTISEAALNRLIGTVEANNLEEMEPPITLTCDLRPYQKQALHWMSTLESVEEASKTLHPCWAAYQIKDQNPVYVNVFSGEMTTKMPSAIESARGGVTTFYFASRASLDIMNGMGLLTNKLFAFFILADAMGLGKTVMTISVILARRGKGIPDVQKNGASVNQSKVEGGTLIICPMALLGQWKDELDTHSEPDSLSVYVQYGAERAYDPRVIAKHDVVLTTYNLISNAFRNDGTESIYHKVNWHRIVLDEAHTIKAWKTQTAKAVFELSSHCRWCLTGTPLQNNLEDLYSLICFLKVEPWCNWTCWRDQIQKPYESNDPRGLSWVKAILKPLMLRRTKETKDKDGRLILELPPTDIQTIVCKQSEAEKDFYMALFKSSKVQFDQFVAQGRVLHNYANILELLLRLRQCCNHPFLIMSRADSERYADLNKLARRFTELQNSEDLAPSRAYVEEVVEGIRRGETAECPICLESPDDPVLTACAHRMCRECLYKCWRTSSHGPCPICRNEVKKADLITCPSEGRFSVDVEKNWKESAKVSKLFEYLEDIRVADNGEKSIIFSQWTAFLNLLEIPLKKRGFGFLRFDGKLSQNQRVSVLHEFNETKHKTVLLMSLKAGGVGLNLTAASNVFLMDPWWNPAVEEQAIMRIHRIGQKRTVIVRRFIVKDTVEERLELVKARKQQMIAGALTDQEVRSVRLEDLKMLFR
ncbi:LOW QUALITY PROTEIN: hypothetical protein V2J09_015819 [Rumex salicifolius]